MEVLKLANEWARAEMFSSKFFVLFGIMFLMGAICFWQMGKTEIAKSFIFPTLVVAVLLLILGIGLYFINRSILDSFQDSYNANPTAFLDAEILRMDDIVASYIRSVFKIMPFIIIGAALLIFLFDKPIIRAICINTIALMIVIMFVDSNAIARANKYKDALKVEKQNSIQLDAQG